MSEISTDERVFVSGELREGALELEAVKDGAALRRLYREQRREIDATPERETAVRRLKDLDDDLGILGGEDGAVQAARRHVADAHYKLASSRE
jgi:hypothetical protein